MPISGASPFYDNTKDNARLARRRAKPKIKGIGRVLVMTPDEVISKLKELGVSISRQTLRNYGKWGLIPEPKRGSKGKGRGRYTDYPDEAVAEAFASWMLLHGRVKFRPEDISKVRSVALQFDGVGNLEDIAVEDARCPGWDLYTYTLFYAWITNKVRVEQNISDDTVINICYVKDISGRPSRMIVLKANRGDVFYEADSIIAYVDILEHEMAQYKQTGANEHLERYLKAVASLENYCDETDKIHIIDLNNDKPSAFTIYNDGYKLSPPRGMLGFGQRRK
jgi:hypothetical protein